MKFEKGYTFDDVLLKPQKSEILPALANIETMLTPSIKLTIPVVSAAMDTVTESTMAEAMAKYGGVGIIHRNMKIEAQAHMIKKVKRSESWFVEEPITLNLNASVKDAESIMNTEGISGIPIVTEDKKLAGIVTRKDILFVDNKTQRVSDIMTRDLITAPSDINRENAFLILKKYKLEKLPLIDKQGRIKRLVTLRDIQKKREHPGATLDRNGRLVVGGAVGTGEKEQKRAKELAESGVDIIVVDTAHGYSVKVIEMVKWLKKNLAGIQVIAGNIATKEAYIELVKAGADAVKIGVGPGSICTTRIVAGVGVPQLTAIMDVYIARKEAGVPIVADGGIRYSGDIVKALAAGADTVMLGNLLAGTDESPGDTILLEGRRYKTYRGMGSLGVLKETKGARYFQEGNEKYVPEGVEGRVPYKGPVKDMLFQLTGGIKSGMGYLGAKTLEELRKKSVFIEISPASQKESHPHDITITRESPNYETPSS